MVLIFLDQNKESVRNVNIREEIWLKKRIFRKWGEEGTEDCFRVVRKRHWYQGSWDTLKDVAQAEKGVLTLHQSKYVISGSSYTKNRF